MEVKSNFSEQKFKDNLEKSQHIVNDRKITFKKIKFMIRHIWNIVHIL